METEIPLLMYQSYKIEGKALDGDFALDLVGMLADVTAMIMSGKCDRVNRMYQTYKVEGKALDGNFYGELFGLGVDIATCVVSGMGLTYSTFKFASAANEIITPAMNAMKSKIKGIAGSTKQKYLVEYNLQFFASKRVKSGGSSAYQGGSKTKDMYRAVSPEECQND